MTHLSIGLFECRPAAERGNVWAMLDLAASYSDGLGQPCDPYVCSLTTLLFLLFLILMEL
jgi:hypothetical protein